MEDLTGLINYGSLISEEVGGGEGRHEESLSASTPATRGTGESRVTELDAQFIQNQ